MKKKTKRASKLLTINIMHPFVLLLYFAGVIGFAMVVREPVFQVEALVMAGLVNVYVDKHRNRKAYLEALIFSGSIVLISAVVNALTYHDGFTILFYINDNPITGEALLYGATFGLMIASMIIWFAVYQKTMTQEKALFLFGKLSPSFALTISMIFRYIPLLKRRYGQVHQANLAMGAYKNCKGMQKIANRAHEFSILVSWSLEESIETAKQMEAKGYGAGNRTSFHRFHFSMEDRVRMALILLVMLATIALLSVHSMKAFFYPKFYYKSSVMLRTITELLYACLAIMPILFDVKRKRK